MMNRLYGVIQGNVTKKELDFKLIVNFNFKEAASIGGLIDLVT